MNPAFANMVQGPQLRSDWFGRFGALVLVCAAHAALLTWLIVAPNTPPARSPLPAVTGELVIEAPTPPLPPPPAPESRPKPQPKPRIKPAPRPEPAPRREPRHEPRPEPPTRPIPAPAAVAPEPAPSERAPSLPAPVPTPEAPPRPAAAASPATAAAPASTGHSEDTAVTPPRSDASALSNPPPPYPRMARTLGEQGRVLLDVYILADGTVGQVKLHRSSGHARLDQAAIDAVRRWHYIPARRGGVPIPYWYVQPIDFELQ